jgi:hypothetical protein
VGVSDWLGEILDANDALPRSVWPQLPVLDMKPHAEDAAALPLQNTPLLLTFVVFVPSLSWQMIVFHREMARKEGVFRTGGARHGKTPVPTQQLTECVCVFLFKQRTEDCLGKIKPTFCIELICGSQT